MELRRAPQPGPEKICYTSQPRAVSSAVEHSPHTGGATGSIPVPPTTSASVLQKKKSPRRLTAPRTSSGQNGEGGSIDGTGQKKRPIGFGWAFFPDGSLALTYFRAVYLALSSALDRKSVV